MKRTRAIETLTATESPLGSIDDTEAELGWQARSVAAAAFVAVGLGVAVGCLARPAGVACAQHPACGAEEACDSCVDVPGCGPLCMDVRDACLESCPLPDECSLRGGLPGRLRCDGLVAGRSGEASRSPAPGGLDVASGEGAPP